MAGTVSPAQADLIVPSVAELPPGDWTRRRGEKLMVRQAAHLDATELARAGRHLVEVVDPDAVDRRLQAGLEREERAAHLDRHLSIARDRAGGVRIRGRGSAEDGALLKAALLPLTRPDNPARTGPVGARRPANPARRDNPATPGRDPREAGARCWDALIALAQHALDTDLPPQTHGTPARLLVTLDHHTLLQQRTVGIRPGRVATTGDGVELPPGTLRRLACDAEIIPAVLDTPGEVLDVGRTRRLVTPAQWTALIAPRPALHLPHLHPTTGHVPRPPPHPLGRRRRHLTGQPRPLVRPPSPRHPPHPLADTPQPPRPTTRIQTPTQTRHHPRMDPLSTQTRLGRTTCRPVPYSGRSPTVLR